MSIYSNDLTYEQVRELFDYDTATGNLLWKKKVAQRVKIGDIVGSPNDKGYIGTKIKGKTYTVHRLVWIWHYGSWPENEIDHINRICSDNRIENLREATDVLQAQNRKIKSINTSGHTGVYWHKRIKKWCVQIGVNKKRIYLGYYEQYEDACRIYDEAKFRYHEF